jgi:pyrroline-5-carboxylate reductase
MERISIFGVGAMGTALASAAKTAYPEAKIFVFDKDKSKVETISSSLSVSAGNITDISNSELVVIAVKPQDIFSVLSEIDQHLSSKQTVLSVAAGVSLAKLKSLISAATPVRCMPNTPALVGVGFSTISVLPQTDDLHLNRAIEFLSAAGKTLVIPENQQDIFTAIHGSGPAYVFLLIEAMVQAAIKEGISKEAATEAVLQTVLGAAELAIASNEPVGVLRERVTSPGGTTEAALKELANGGFVELMQIAVQAARKRAAELG